MICKSWYAQENLISKFQLIYSLISELCIIICILCSIDYNVVFSLRSGRNSNIVLYCYYRIVQGTLLLPFFLVVFVFFMSVSIKTLLKSGMTSLVCACCKNDRWMSNLSHSTKPSSCFVVVVVVVFVVVSTPTMYISYKSWLDLLYPLIPKWVPLNDVKMFARPRKFGFIQDRLIHRLNMLGKWWSSST